MSILSKIIALESDLKSEMHVGVVKAFGTSDSKRNPGSKVSWAICSINGADYMVSNKDAIALTKGQEVTITAYENKQGEAWLQL